MSQNCPHCGAPQDSTSAFCTECGNALPVGSGGPRVMTGGLAQTAAGRTLQSSELKTQMNKASGALLAVAVLQTLFGGLILFAMDALPVEGAQGAPKILLYATVFGIAGIFYALWLWARVQPFPAAVTGLVIFITVHLLDALADPTNLARGIIINVLIIAVLARAVSAGAKYQRLQREQRLAV